jgi:tetratricopeptide (TPR) repeat protein
LLPAAAAGQLAAFEEGNQLYQDGDYQAALDRYLQISEAGYESGEAYYNIGNSYFKLGDLGLAIVNYQRALRLMPRDDDVRTNLELANSLTADEIVPLPGFWLVRAIDWWVYAIPRSWLIAIVLASYLLAMGALVTRIMTRSLTTRAWAFRGAVAASVVAVVFGLNLAAMEVGFGRPLQAVVLSDEITVQSAPSEDSALQVFTLHEGAMVRIDQQTGEWAEVVLADGKVGWVKKEALEVI